MHKQIIDSKPKTKKERPETTDDADGISTGNEKDRNRRNKIAAGSLRIRTV